VEDGQLRRREANGPRTPIQEEPPPAVRQAVVEEAGEAALERALPVVMDSRAHLEVERRGLQPLGQERRRELEQGLPAMEGETTHGLDVAGGPPQRDPERRSGRDPHRRHPRWRLPSAWSSTS